MYNMILYASGNFTLPITALREPPPTLKVRDVKQWYVDYLADMLTSDDNEMIICVCRDRRIQA